MTELVRGNMSHLRMVTGPPGTGKSTSLLVNAEKAMKYWSPREVIICSLTKAAAANIKQRKVPIPLSQVKTIHAHCYSLMDRPKIAETEMKSWNEAQPGFSMEPKKSFDEDADPGGDGNYSEHGKTLLEDYAKKRAGMVPQKRWPTRTIAFGAAWEIWKDENGFLDFQDLVDNVIKEEIPPPGRAKYILVDECQDCSAKELELLKVWSNSANIVMTGDVDQLIFSFRGSSPEAFNALEIPDSQRRVLGKSYRVPKAVCEYANAWIKQIKTREDVTYLPRDYPGEVRRIDKGFHHGHLGALLDDAQRYAGKSIMFLASCGYMLYDLIGKLKELGVPFYNPYREEELRWNPLRSLGKSRMSGADRIRAFLGISGNGTRWTHKTFNTWMGMVESKGLFRNGAKSDLAKIVEDQPKGVDFEILHDEEFASYFVSNDKAYEAIEAGWKGDASWLENKLLKSKSKGAKYALKVVDNCGPEHLNKRPNLIVGTIHSTKGGESDVVYLLPSISASSKAYARGANGKEGLDALRRMFYVGMTRARESLILCQGGGSSGQFNMRWL